MAESTLPSEAVVPASRADTADSPYRLTPILAVVTCAATPTYTVRWQLGFYPTTLLEVLILLTVGAFVVEAYRARTPIDWHSSFAYPAVLFLVAGLVAVAVSPDRRGGAGLFRAYLLEPIAFFLVVGTVVRRAQLAYLLLGGLAAGGLVAGLANSAVVLAAIHAHTFNLSVAQPAVIYNTPNAVALFLIPLIAVAGSVALHASEPRLRLASVAFAGLAGAATLLSFSRGGYAALAAVAIALAVSHGRRWWLLGGLAVVGLALVKVPFLSRRLAHELNSSDPNNSLVSRVKLWTATLHMLRDHPVLGTGLSGFARSIGPFRGGVFEEQLIYPHNIVLNFWTETGLLGLAAFTWLMVQAFRTSLRGWRVGRAEWRPLQLGVAVAMVAIVVHGLVDVPYWKNDLSLEFWTLLGLSWAGLRWASPGAEPQSPPERQPAAQSSRNLQGDAG